VASFDVVLSTRGSLHPDGEPSEFVSEHTGIVTCTDDTTGETTRVGRVHAWRVDGAVAWENGESLYDVCDAHSDELHRVHALLYEPTGYQFRDEWEKRFEAVGPNLLVLDYVVLAPKWRGLKLGLLAVRRVVDLLGGGCDLAVSHLAPLRRDAHQALRVPAHWLPEADPAGTGRLRRYFRRMGFRRLGRSPYYALPLNLVTPTADRLLDPTPKTPSP
jgi:GNAT superfamily N-acetyltransferase